MAETEVSNGESKMVAIEEKCGLDVTSYQDLPKPDCNGTNHHNQAHDLDNSYVFVSGDDGLVDDVDNKNVEANDLTDLPESGAAGVEDQRPELHSQIKKIDADSGEFQPLNEVESRNVELSNDDSPLVNEVESRNVELSNDDSPLVNEVENRNVELSNDDSPLVNEVENRNVELSNEDSPLVNADSKDVEAEGLSVLPESDAVGVEDQGLEFHSQIEKNDAVSGEFQPLNEAESRNFEPSNGGSPLVNVEPSDGGSPLVNVDNKDVEAESSSVLIESNTADVKDQGADLDSQNKNIDAITGKFQHPTEAENMNVEQSNGDPPLVNVNNNNVEAEDSSVVPESDVGGVEHQELELHSQIEKNDAVSGDFQPLNEAENRNVEPSNREHPLVNGDVEDVVSEGSNVLRESVAVRVEDQGLELHSQIEKIDDVSGEFQSLNEAENRNVELRNGDPHIVIANNKDVEAEDLSVLPESDIAEVKDQEVELGSHNEKFSTVSMECQPLKEVGNRNVEQSNGDPTPVNGSTSKHDSSHDEGEGIQVSLDDSMEEHTLKTESPAEAEVKQVQDQDGNFENLAEADIEKAMDQNGKNGESNNILLHTSSSHSASKDQSDLSVSEALRACQGSQDTVVQVVACELQDVTLDAEDEEKSVAGKVETVESKVSSSTSFNLDLELHPVHSKDETLEQEAKTTFCSIVHENQQGDTAIGNYVQAAVGQMDESNIVVSSTESHLQNVSNMVLEGKNEAFCVSEADNGVQYPEQADKQPDLSGMSQDTMPSDTKTEASLQTQNYPAVSALAYHREIEISGKEPVFHGGKAQAETEVSRGDTEVADCAPVTVDVKVEPEVHSDGVPATSRREKTDDAAVLCETEVSDSFIVNKEAANIVLDSEGNEDIEEQLDRVAGNSNEDLVVLEGTGKSQSNEITVASAAGGSSVNMSGEENIKIKTKPFNFLIRIPRFDDENLREQIRLSKLLVDEKTKLRDAIQIQIQEKRANSQIHGIDYEYAKNEARSARKLVRSKRMEIDSLQSVINKAKNALSIEDIDSQILNLEHMIQHETLPLKEEKQFIREIKQLKQLREQLSSNIGSQDEIKQALEQREEVEDRLKVLRKELDVLKHRVLQAEATAAEAEKKYDDENKKVKEIQAQFRAADDVRQAAYAQWQNFRKELSKKSKHFFKYKDDAAVASNCAFSRDTEALYRLCMNQVENFMELWNTNDEFRRDYVKFNARSTVRRFGTLDGRPLGPDEEPPQLPSYGDERARRMASAPVKVNLASQVPSPEVKPQETSNENVVRLDDKSMKKMMESKNQKVTKGPTAITIQANVSDTLSGRDQLIDEEPVKSREEIESVRKEEEKRRLEAEAKLKEQRRLEALAKAHEARERKKRQAEKLQMRAELKTQKEAEQREKEREKRLRKKERKKGVVTDGNNDVNNNWETGPSSESAAENGKDTEVKDMPLVAPKKTKKPWLFAKQSKAKSIPPPLRNRNKKKLQQWMWVAITCLIIVVLFWLGNIGVFSKVALKRRGPPVH